MTGPSFFPVRGRRVPPVAERPVEVRFGSSDLALQTLRHMAMAVVVFGPSDDVVLANPRADALGVLVAGRPTAPELLDLVRRTRRDGVARARDVEVGRRRGVGPSVTLHVRAERLQPPGHVLLLVEDTTDSRRVEAVRRDFVANVSHELKTPVGALSLLAEATAAAADDPEAVRHFAGRMRREAGRLGRLVQELIDLSRVQGADPLPGGAAVEVDDVVAEAVDRCRPAAEASRIRLQVGGDRGVVVRGSEQQLVTALVNLIENAVAYSPELTQVGLGIRRAAGRDPGTADVAGVEISVADQGIGIAPQDRERIFERFYRVDPARSRDTGGTGLGLAIVRHIVENHGGAVRVWSVVGSGSTFKVWLPAAGPAPVRAPVGHLAAEMSLAPGVGPEEPVR